MINIDSVVAELSRFNAHMEGARTTKDFNELVRHLNTAREAIDAIKNGAIKQMLQESHDLTQVKYNELKDKNYVSTIRF